MTKRNDIETDAALVERVLAGDDRAFKKLVERHKEYAFTLAMRILNHREEAEEVAQDAFVRAYRGLIHFQKEAKFTTWLYRIVLNCALSMQQKRKPSPVEVESAVLLRGEEAQPLKQGEQRFFIEKALALLSPDDAAVVTLFYLKEQSLEEIAVVLNAETNAVKVRLHRARKRMADLMQQLLRGEAQNLI